MNENDAVVWSALKDVANQLAECICELFRGESERAERALGVRVESAEVSIAGVRVEISAAGVAIASDGGPNRPGWLIRLPMDRRERWPVSLDILRETVDRLWDTCQWHVVTMAVERAIKVKGGVNPCNKQRRTHQAS